MIGLQTELKLAHLLKAIADGEKDIEVIRQVLAEQPDFEPYTAFKRIDRDANSSLSLFEIHDFLRDNDLPILESDVHNLIKVFDLDGDRRISYTEFLNIVLPKTSPSLRHLATSRQSYFVSRFECLPYEAEWALARVFDKEIDYFRKIELLKEDLSMRYDYNHLDAFKIIDEDRTGFIDLDALYLFFKRNHIHATESDILALFRRVDQDGDGKISFSEFSECLTAHDPYYKVSMRSSTIRERVSTPMRHSQHIPRSRLLSSSHVFHSASKKKLSNLDYYDYLSTSARKASLSRSRILSSSPVRHSSPKRLSESSVLRTSSPVRKLNESVYQTPSKSRARSPVKEHKSPIKEVEDNELARALKEQIDLDRDLENLKNELSLRNDFNLLDAFRFFDIDARGYITKNELKDGLNSFDIFPTSNELYLLMRKFDTDNDGLLRYAEFCDILTPKQAEYSSVLNDRIPSYLDSSKLHLIFSYETRRCLKNVLDMTLSNEILSEDLRQKIARRPFFNIYEAFKTLDKNDNGFVDISEFRDLLVDHGVYASSKELMNLVKRYDKNQDGKVSYYDFVQELTPKSPTKY